MVKNILGIELCDKLTRETDWNAPTVELIQAMRDWEVMRLADIVLRLPGHTLYRIANLFSIGEDTEAKAEYKATMSAASDLLQKRMIDQMRHLPERNAGMIHAADRDYLNAEVEATLRLRSQLRQHILNQIED